MTVEPNAMSERERRLQQVLVAYLEAAEKGRSPDPGELASRYPEFAAELGEFFANHAHMERLTAPLRAVVEAAQAEADARRTLGTEAGPAVGTKVRYFGDYELLEEIARGGMGVVYKARQVSLNRVVALKMILAGQLASDTDVRRFRAEAEAAANLDHLNILPIYEVGEHQGQHYFSMKLVTGGSLATRMMELRADPRSAIALLAQVAQAVHFAHQRGVLHRDLKPGNVLLDSLTPYVADFGLAKRVEADSSLTASGAIVGTPSYMPPEQARAEKSLTVAADVYALGAILYEVLTGRPPFRGASQVETLLQVLEHEPTPPRQHNPAIARDLETVCLKCLAKEQAGRYASAGELGDELERWLAGEAVSACPPTRSERLARWGKRNPVLLALGMAMLMGVGLFVVLALLHPRQEVTGVAAAFAGIMMALFFAYMFIEGRSRMSALEKRLRRERPAAAGAVSADPAVPAPPVDAVSRGDLLRSLWQGARNGAFLGAGAASGLIVWAGAWVPLPDPRSLSREGVNLRPEAVVAAVAVGVVAVLAGAVAAVLTRALVRPFGRIAWGLAWLAAGIAVGMGTSGAWQRMLSEDMAEGKWYRPWLVIAAPTIAVCVDWWTRYHVRIHRHTAATGKMSPEMGRILEEHIPASDVVVKHLPVLLLAGGVLAGHFIGAAAGRAIAPAPVAEVGADFGALIGRVSGALVGALLTVGLLRLYEVEADTPWPGQGDRPYPRALAALYLLATAALAAVWLL